MRAREQLRGEQTKGGLQCSEPSISEGKDVRAVLMQRITKLWERCEHSINREMIKMSVKYQWLNDVTIGTIPAELSIIMELMLYIFYSGYA